MAMGHLPNTDVFNPRPIEVSKGEPSFKVTKRELLSLSSTPSRHISSQEENLALRQYQFMQQCYASQEQQKLQAMQQLQGALGGGSGGMVSISPLLGMADVRSHYYRTCS